MRKSTAVPSVTGHSPPCHGIQPSASGVAAGGVAGSAKRNHLGFAVAAVLELECAGLEFAGVEIGGGHSSVPFPLL